MRANVQTIKFTGISSIVLVIITYLIAIKGTLGMHDAVWLPDSFLLAVFGGAFASMLVVLICEISKYWQNKKSTEVYLFSHIYYLYGQLQIVSKSIHYLFTLSENEITQGALTQLITNAEAEMNTIYFVDYAPFFTDDAILKEKLKYNSECFPVVQSFLQDCMLLDVAIVTDRINSIKAQMTNSDTPNESGNTNRVLKRLSELIEEPIRMLDGLEQRIDEQCGGRFGWEKTRDAFLLGLPDNQPDRLEKFIND